MQMICNNMNIIIFTEDFYTSRMCWIDDSNDEAHMIMSTKSDDLPPGCRVVLYQL